MERRSVGEVHKRNARLGVAPGADPAFDRDRRIIRRLPSQNRAHVELILLHRPTAIIGLAWIAIQRRRETAADAGTSGTTLSGYNFTQRSHNRLALHQVRVFLFHVEQIGVVGSDRTVADTVVCV